MEVIRLLQMSDIHWTRQLDSTDDYTDIREKMLEDLGYYCQATGNKFDKILICGDIAFSGSRDEYERANTFIADLCKKVNCKDDEVYTVPGNHDKNVNSSSKTVREFLHLAFSHHDKDVDKWWEDILGEDFTFIKKLFLPFAEYNKFSNEDHDNPEPFMVSALDNKTSEYDKSPMFWRTEFDESLNGHKINLYGVNSALISDLGDYDTDEKRKDGHLLYLPKQAYHSAKIADGVINILMCHHPLKFLRDSDDIAKDLDKRYALQLYGHVHIADSNMENNAVHIFSGSLNPGNINDKRYLPVYNIIELSINPVNKEQDVLTVKLCVRKYNGENFNEDKEQSKEYRVILKKHDTWVKERQQEETKQSSLPDGLTKRDVRHRFKDSPQAKDIIKSMYPEINCNVSAYMRNQVFLEKVRTDNRWLDLYNKLSNE